MVHRVHVQVYTSLVGCKMIGMTQMFMAGCKIRTLWQEQHLFILTSGMRDSFKIDVRMRKDAQLKEKIIVHESYMVNYYFPNKTGSRLTF